MAKQLNVDLAFRADTSQAQKSIQELQNSLNKVGSIQPKFGMSLTKEMQSAVTSAKELEAHINNALDANTGNLDLSKLNSSLKASGTDLATLSSNLLKAGISGEQAFMNIQRSVAKTSVQIKQANGLLAEFWTTLKNTARWQLSSSMLHGFMGAMQSAYGYAQDLDKSLNNIRIVTGYNVDTMAQFAEQANKAAKALSTTTTSYTDAALIFYQQGLSENDVTKRTDTVIKMANVTGESAQSVSNYMTAVWNNFDDGSKSLEYYADVMTALGAATASSTDEIAAGLEKFAAISETVGLSYEYATSALATVTAETRQSADVVGTAFKTIFARIQGLSLGETLEDGVDLNKYSAALQTIGVEVLDANGNMRQMDAILEDMGAKWQTLSEAQKTATAQTVAGVRQYSQLMSLMNNWDVFKENLSTAYDAEGTLQSQADIYEESWAAASKRVKASLEGLYNDLIPKDFIVSMTNAIADVVEMIDALVSGFGGLPQILLLISNIALTKLGPSLTVGLNSGIEKIGAFIARVPELFTKGWGAASTGSAELINNISYINNGLKTAKDQSEYFAQNFEKAASESLKTGQSLNAEAIDTAAKKSIILSDSFEQYLTDTGKVYNLQGLIEQNVSKLTAEEKERLTTMQQQTLELAAQKAEAQAALDIAQRAQERRMLNVGESVYTNNNYNDSSLTNKPLEGFAGLPSSEMVGPPAPLTNVMSSVETNMSATNERSIQLLQTWSEIAGSISNTDVSVSQINGHLALTSTQTDGIGKAASGSAEAYGNIVDINEKISTVLGQQGVSLKEKRAAIHRIINIAENEGKISSKVAQNYRSANKALKTGEKSIKNLTATLTQTSGQARQVAVAFGNSTEHLDSIRDGVYTVADAEYNLNEKQKQFNLELDRTIQYLSTAGSKASTFGGMITSGLQGMSTIAMGVNGVSNAIKTLNDDSAGFGQKLTAITSGAVMGFNGLKTAISGVGGVISTFSNGVKATKVGMDALTAATKLNTNADLASMNSTKLKTLATLLSNKADEQEIATELSGLGVKNASTLATQMSTMAKEGNAIGALKLAATNIKLAATEYAVLWPLLLIVAAVAAVVAAFAIWDACTVSAAEKTERLTANVQNMKEAASEAKEEAKGLREAFENYEEVKNTLDGCTVGTTEWKTAMEGVRDAIDGILEKYPDLARLAELLVWDENTQSYILDEGKVEDYIEGKENAANALDYGARMAEGYVQQDRANSAAGDFTTKLLSSNYDKGYSNEGFRRLQVTDFTGDDAADRALIENAFRNDAIAGNLVDPNEYAAKNEYGETLYNEDGSIQLADPEGYQAALDSYVQGQMDANSELINSLLGIAETYRSINGIAENIFNNASKIEASEKYGGQGKTEAEINAAAEVIDDNYQEVYNSLMGADGTGTGSDSLMASAFRKGNSNWDSLSDEGKAILQRYEKAMGGEAIDWSDNLVQGTDANRTFHINGQKDGITPEEIAATIAAYEALDGQTSEEEQKAAMTTVSTALSGANNIGDGLISAITQGGSQEAMSNFLSTLTQKQINGIMASVNEDGSFDADKLKEYGLDPATLENVGQIFDLGVNEIGSSLLEAGKTITNFTDDQQAILDESKANLGNSTIQESKDFAAAKSEAIDHLGEESNIDSKIFSDIESQNADNVEGLTSFYEGLNEIDLSSEDAAQQVQDLADKYNITGSNVEKFIEQVNATDKTFNIATDDIAKNAQAIKDVVGDGLETGDIISEEDMQKLKDAGIDTSEYFTQMADGSYVLTAAAKEFNDTVNNITFDALKDQINDFQDAREQAINNVETSSHYMSDENKAKFLTDTSKVGIDDFTSSYGTAAQYAATELGQTRLGYINSFEAGSFDFSTEQLDLLNAYQTNPQLSLTAEQLEMVAAMIDIVNAKEGEMQSQALLTATSLNDLNTKTNELGGVSTAAYGDALVVLASKMEGCEGAIEDYNNVIAQYGENSEEAKEAQKDLSKAIQKAQWKKFTKSAKDAAKALENLTDPSEVEDNLKTIQKAFEESFGMDVSIEMLDKYKDKFIEWANAGEDASNDIATKIYSLISLEQAAEDPISITTDITDAGFKVNNLTSIFDQVKTYIETNGITVSATGQADLSGMVAELLASGKTAAEVAAALKAIGQTQVSFDAFGSGLATYDIGTVDGLIAFINDLTAFNGSLTTGGDVPDADTIQEAFGESGFTGTGGGTIPAGDKSGGGGGGKKNVTRKDARNDGERYHYLNNQLEDLTAEYEAISDAADRAFGADKLKLMDDQIEKTKELKQQNEDYIKALQKNHSVDQEVMKAQYANLLGDNALQFDIDNEKGEIRNFDDIQQSMIDDYNAKADLYEAGDMSEEDWQAYEKLYEQVEKDIEMYEQSEDDLRDALARRKELEYQEIDEKLAKIEYAAEVKLEISQDELDVIEYQLELLDDKAFSSADKIAQNVTKASNLVGQMETTQQAMNDILSASNISDSDIATLLDPDTTKEQMEAILKGKNITESQVDSIRNYRDSLLDMNKDLIEVRNTIREEVTNAFEEWNEELDKGISKFDHYNSVLESYQNIIGIVGKDVLGVSDEMMAEMSATKVENSINQLNSMREKYESITKARDDALAKSKDMSLTQEDRDYWAEQYETMNESAQEAQEELMSTWESTLEGIVAQFEESVQRAVDAFNKAIYDGGLEGLSEDFEWEQEKDDMYLDDYQKIYELSKMTRDINKTMDDTKSIAGKQKLKGLIEDINKLQEEGVEMSEYDLEYLQAEYDLRLAEIALEDAQRAKDTVRLSRDSEGNFSYVYTQNTDAVDEAQQKYEDALYSMQDLSSNYIDEMSAQLIETSQAMQEELAALRVEDYASIDEYYAAVAEVEAKYQDKLSRQEAELQKAIGNNKELYDQDWANYAAATGYKISATEDFVTAWGDTTLAGMMGLDDTTSFTSVIGNAAESLISGLLDAANTYYNNMDSANEAAGTSTGQFAEMLQENIEAIQTESTAAAESVQKMADSMDTAMQKIMDQTALWQQEHSKNIEKIIADNLKAAESYNGLLEYLSNNAVGNYEVLIRGSTNGSGEGQSSSDGAADAVSCDTGGYTGNWGTSDGKLAWLHEKELVLNQSDTANMLKAIEMTRYLMSVIDAQANQLSQGLGSLQAATIHEERQETLEQYVEIKADFPNVSNHTEIEEALGNLINTASQYANRRK